MPSIAFVVVDWLERHPDLSPSVKKSMLDEVPPHQWALPGGYFNDLKVHCCNRREIADEPRFMNRLAFYQMTPAPRCLYRSPDGRGLAWLKSGGSVLSYGRCEQQHCERARSPG